MGTLQIDRFRILAGLRHEATDVKGISNQSRISAEERARRAAWVGPVTPAEAVRRLEDEMGPVTRRHPVPPIESHLETPNRAPCEASKELA